MSATVKWTEENIGEGLKLLSGYPFSSSKFSNEDGFPLIRIRDVVDSSIETYYLGSFLPMYVIKHGDMLVGMDGDFNLARWENQDALLNQRVLKVDVLDTEKLDREFVYYWLQPYVRKVNELTAATTVKHLSTKDIRKAKSNIPSLLAQRKIGKILKTIDQAIEKTEALIEKYQQIKAGLMHDLFTRGIGADGQLRPPREQAPELYQQTPIGWIPKEWVISSLTSIASYQHGRPFPSADYCDEGVLLLRPGNLHISGYVLFDDAHSTHIPEYWVKQASSYVVTKDDILMNLTAQSLDDEFLGRVCLYEDTELSLLNQRIARFKALTIEHEFLYWILRSKQFRKQIDNTSQGTKVQHLYNRDLDRVKLGVPSNLKEQTGIAMRLNKVSEKIRAEMGALQKLRQQKSGLMHDLLTGKVPVNVDQAEVAHVV